MIHSNLVIACFSCCLQQKRLRMISILGAGLLVGTALAVIIPEGVHALYESQEHGELHCELRAGKKKNLNCSLSFGQAAVTFCLS